MEASAPLSIIRLSQSITGSEDANSSAKRSSDVSAESANNGDMTPSSLAIDLVHYKELFTKLRFSYIEQVTKEKFLRAITSDIPLFVEPQENARLEQQLAEEKSTLKEQKTEVEDLTIELEARGKELAKRYEGIQLQQAHLASLPSKITNLETTIAELHSSHPSPAKSSNPNLNLSLPATLSILSQREAASSNLDAQIRALQSSLPRKQRELGRMEGELHPLMNHKKTVVAQAKEARQRREEGGVDEMEERGRWYRAADSTLRGMLAEDS